MNLDFFVGVRGAVFASDKDFAKEPVISHSSCYSNIL
jgi:hypothetical protein